MASAASCNQTINGGTFPPYYWTGGRGTCRAVRPLRRPAVPAVGFPPIEKGPQELLQPDKARFEDAPRYLKNSEHDYSIRLRTEWSEED